MKKQLIQNILIFSAIFVFAALPVLVSAQDNGPFIPCGGPGQHDCGYNDILILVNNIIKWIIIISAPVAAGIFAWAGLKMMMNASNPGKRAESISMMKKVFIGFVFILSAWIIVGTITKALINPDANINIPVDVSINKSINLYI